MAKLGAEPMLMRPDEFDTYIRNEITDQCRAGEGGRHPITGQ